MVKRENIIKMSNYGKILSWIVHGVEKTENGDMIISVGAPHFQRKYKKIVIKNYMENAQLLDSFVCDGMCGREDCEFFTILDPKNKSKNINVCEDCFKRLQK